MSIVLVAGPAEVRADVCGDRFRDFETREVPDIDSVTSMRRLAACVVVCLDEVTRADVLALERLGLVYPRRSTVVVAPLTASTVPLLTPVPGLIEQVVWRDQVGDQLRERVAVLTTSTFLDTAADVVVGLPQIPELVAKFFRVAWTSPTPGITVDRILHDLDVSDSTFRDAWSVLPLGAAPKDVIDWAILSRAIVEVRGGASWDTAAYRLGVHRRRFRRIARRLLGVEHAELRVNGLRWVEKEFLEWLLVEIVAPVRRRAS